MHRYKNMKQNKATILPFSQVSTLLNPSVSLDNRGTLNLASDRNHYFSVIVDHFSNYILTQLTPKIRAYYAVQTIIYHRISKYGPS